MSEVRIRGAADLLAAVRSPDLVTRLAVLQACGAAPEQALACGADATGDIVDELLRQAAADDRGQGWSQTARTALLRFRDPRVVRYAEDRLATATEPDELEAVTDRLAEEPLTPHRRRLLGQALGQSDALARVRAAARLLRGVGDLTLAERLRLALVLNPGEIEPPDWDEATAELWLAELAGPLAEPARETLRSLGQPAFEGLAAVWERLPEALLVWLLEWGASACPAAATELAWRVLTAGGPALSTALLVLAREPLEPADARRLEGWLDHPEPAVRRAAVLAGAALDRPFEPLADPAPGVRQAGLHWLARVRGEAAIEPLLAALADDEWSVRAVAADLLVARGPAVLPRVRPLTAAPRPAIRVAAVRILADLGDHEWCEEHCLA